MDGEAGTRYACMEGRGMHASFEGRGMHVWMEKPLGSGLTLTRCACMDGEAFRP